MAVLGVNITEISNYCVYTIIIANDEGEILIKYIDFMNTEKEEILTFQKQIKILE